MVADVRVPLISGGCTDPMLTMPMCTPRYRIPRTMSLFKDNKSNYTCPTSFYSNSINQMRKHRCPAVVRAIRSLSMMTVMTAPECFITQQFVHEASYWKTKKEHKQDAPVYVFLIGRKKSTLGLLKTDWFGCLMIWTLIATQTYTNFKISVWTTGKVTRSFI